MREILQHQKKNYIPTATRLVPGVKVDGRVVMHVTAFRAVSGLRVPANLNFQHLQRSAEAGFEQVVQDVGALWLHVVDQQTASGASTRKSTC